MATINNQDDFIKTALRLPRKLHSEIQMSAEKNSRSMNTEIIDRLDSSFDSKSSSGIISTIERLEVLLTTEELKFDGLNWKTLFLSNFLINVYPLLKENISKTDDEELKSLFEQSVNIIDDYLNNDLVIPTPERSKTLKSRVDYIYKHRPDYKENPQSEDTIESDAELVAKTFKVLRDKFNELKSQK